MNIKPRMKVHTLKNGKSLCYMIHFNEDTMHLAAMGIGPTPLLAYQRYSTNKQRTERVTKKLKRDLRRLK